MSIIASVGGILLGVLATALPDCLSNASGPIPCLATRSYTELSYCWNYRGWRWCHSAELLGRDEKEWATSTI